LEFGKPGNLPFASGTPRSPEIKENHFAVVVLKPCCIAGTVFQSKLRRRFAFVWGLEDGADRKLIDGASDAYHRKPQD
jgi:hypothetical protein